MTKNIVLRAGHDAWISVAAGGVLVLLASLLIIALCRRYRSQSILDINRIIFGKYLSWFFNSIFILYLIFSTGSNLMVLIQAIMVWFFRSTPSWAITLYVMLPSVYLAYKGLKGICRFNILLFVTIPMLIFAILFTLNHFHLTNLLPFGVHGLGNILGAVPETMFSYMGFETLLFLLPYIKDKQNMIRKTSIGLVMTTLLYTLYIAASVAVFGEEIVSKRFSALFSFAKTMEVPVLERVDLYYLTMWIPAMILAVNAYLFLACDSVRTLYGIPSKKVPLAVISILVFLFSVMASGDVNTSNQVMQIAGYSILIIGVAYPLLMMFLSLIMRKGVDKGP